MYRWILFLCHLPQHPFFLSCFWSVLPVFCVFFYMLLPSPAVCWLEVFSPKARRCWTKNQLWTTDPQVTHPPAVMLIPPQPSSLFLSLSYTHKEPFVFHLIHVNTFRVCPDHVAVCGLMKLTADAEKYRWPRGAPHRRQALHKMPTVCLIALFSISHIARCRCLTFAIPLLGEFLSESSEPENPALLWVHLEFWFYLHCIKASLEIIKSVCSFYSSFILTVWMSPQLQQR